MSTPNTSAPPMEAGLVWDKLARGLDTAYRRENMSSIQYMELYSSVYNYCTSITLSGGNNNRRPPDTANNMSSRLAQSGAGFVGQELYKRVKTYVIKCVNDIREKSVGLVGESLLAFYTSEWINFRISSKVMDGIFSYLNRHWIKRELDEGKDDIFMIYTLSLSLWKIHLFTTMKDKVMDAVLDLIKRERNGEVIDNKYISGVVECLVELGIDEYEPTEVSVKKTMEKDKLVVYRECFELKFLEATREYYTKEAEMLLEENITVPEYMLKVEKRLEEEDNRCQLYLNMSTKKPLAACCEDVLIAKKLEFFQSQFCGLLLDNRDEDLARMFKLCDRVHNGLDELRSTLEQHIMKEGLEAVEKVAPEAVVDARLYVKTLLEVHHKYQVLVKNSFNSDPGFTQSLDKAATTFINKNAITYRGPNTPASNKSAELLAKYCDQLLKKSSKKTDERELEEALNTIIIVFKYIEDKDVFSKFYTRMFSRRLINELSSSDDSEASFISKLKNMCGYEYTAKLSKMVNDTQVSKDLVIEFKDKMAAENKKTKNSMEFNILILSSGSWPTFPNLNLTLPARISESVEYFSKFYNEKFNGRKLSWLISQSRGEITAQCYSKKYMFTSTTAQMAAILLFNEQDSFTMSAITEAMGMDIKASTSVVASLIKSELLKCDKDNVQLEDIPLDAVISLNMNYSNKKVRVDLSKMAIKQDMTRDHDVVQKNVNDDRKAAVNACIVRIMKTYKKLHHKDLLIKAIEQLSAHFKPNVDFIKRCIESLIEKEYMTRLAENRELYEYIS